MTQLWLAFAILLLPALWLLIVPLRRAEGVRAAQCAAEQDEPGTEQNVSIYRRRLASLEAALARGDIDAERFEEDRLELERGLLEDTERSRRSPLKSALSGRLLVPVTMIVLVAVSVFWYRHEGAEDDLALRAAQQQVLQKPDASVSELVQALEIQTARQPENADVWRALFPLYRDTGRVEDAESALTRLIELEGRRPALLAELAQLRYFAAGRTLDEDVQALVDEVLAEAPDQPTVLGMLGIDAFESGDYRLAIDRWRRAIAGMGDTGSADALRQGIETAQRRLEASGQAGNGKPGNTQTNGGASPDAAIDRVVD
ncbi:c-type cytochrome biogenesis protein CcmI [Halomonas elongata]|uniref:c-type cytochrome biogenesis protein CcmI n=1 Tax=Halomonas elongata TaxID=2746 RepID=UPI002E28DFA4|nr:c-type cytochrome biogenesis protein CcmI [Halomonas elongata]WVI70980.1 c-type cytochrome biogenesis protein CcmI [Halomonas elongata]